MWLKVVIVFLFIAVVLSLSSALILLLKDIDSRSKRTLYALGIRVSLAALLLACIFYGFYTERLTSSAPWDRGPVSPAHIQR
jgi:predicted membrane-bound mannosyltransferase